MPNIDREFDYATVKSTTKIDWLICSIFLLAKNKKRLFDLVSMFPILVQVIQSLKQYLLPQSLMYDKENRNDDLKRTS